MNGRGFSGNQKSKLVELGFGCYSLTLKSRGDNLNLYLKTGFKPYHILKNKGGAQWKTIVWWQTALCASFLKNNIKKSIYLDIATAQLNYITFFTNNTNRHLLIWWYWPKNRPEEAQVSTCKAEHRCKKYWLITFNWWRMIFTKVN